MALNLNPHASRRTPVGVSDPDPYRISSVGRTGSGHHRPAASSYSYIRPHGGIGGKTPAQAAGIKILGRNKWLTPIQNAADAA